MTVYSITRRFPDAYPIRSVSGWVCASIDSQEWNRWSRNVDLTGADGVDRAPVALNLNGARDTTSIVEEIYAVNALCKAAGVSISYEWVILQPADLDIKDERDILDLIDAVGWLHGWDAAAAQYKALVPPISVCLCTNAETLNVGECADGWVARVTQALQHFGCTVTHSDEWGDWHGGQKTSEFVTDLITRSPQASGRLDAEIRKIVAEADLWCAVETAYTKAVEAYNEATASVCDEAASVCDEAMHWLRMGDFDLARQCANGLNNPTWDRFKTACQELDATNHEWQGCR